MTGQSSRIAAVVGCGRRSGTKEGWAVGHAHADGYLSAFPGIVLYGVDPNEENLLAFGERFGVPQERLFASVAELYQTATPQVVSICTWPALHRPMVLEAVAAGVRGIICEKPLALDGSEIDEMLSACRSRGVALAVAHQRAYDANFTEAKRLIQSGVLGEKLVIEARVGDGWDILSWSVHWFDVTSWLYDADAEWVLAGMDHTGERRYQHAVEDCSVVFLQFPQERQGIFVTGPDVNGGSSFCIRGTEGMLHVESDLLRLWSRDGYREIEPEPVEFPGFAGLAREVFGCVEQRTAIRCGAERSAKATMLALAAQESARTMRRIDLPTGVRYAPLEIAQHPPLSQPISQRALLLADSHHADPVTGQGGREALAEVLSHSAITSLQIIEAEKEQIAAEHLENIDLLVLYHTQRQIRESSRQALEDWVESGKPLAVIHCGIGAYPDWPRFREWLGYYWVWQDETDDPSKHSRHPHEPCEIVIDDLARLQVGWQRAWLPRDEVYINLGQAAAVRLLASAKLPDGSTHPLAWQSEKHPNVAVWAPGHRADVCRLPVMRQGIAATLRLLLQQ